MALLKRSSDHWQVDPDAEEGRSIMENDAIHAEHELPAGEYAIVYRWGGCAGIFHDRETAERVAAMHSKAVDVVPATAALRVEYDKKVFAEMRRCNGSF